MPSTTVYINTTVDELRVDIRTNERTQELYAVVKYGDASAIIFGADRPEDLAARLRHLADDVIGETARLRAEAAGQSKLTFDAPQSSPEWVERRPAGKLPCPAASRPTNEAP